MVKQSSSEKQRIVMEFSPDIPVHKTALEVIEEMEQVLGARKRTELLKQLAMLSALTTLRNKVE